MTNPISEECAAIAARERRDEVLDALACALMDADRIHQPGACICRRDDGFTVQLQPGVEYPHAVEVDGNPVGVSKGARLALLHALGGVPAEDRAPEGPSGSVPAAEPDSWERVATDARKEFLDYWSCRGIKCIDCPAKVGGHRPSQWYDTVNCVHAMDADIVRRIRALAGVTDDE